MDEQKKTPRRVRAQRVKRLRVRSGSPRKVVRPKGQSDQLATQQLKLLCRPSTYERLKNEKLLQGRPLQDLLNDALEMALDTWEHDHDLSPNEGRVVEDQYEIDQDVEEMDALQRGLIPYKSETFLLRHGEYQWMQMWMWFMRDLPEDTVSSTKRIMKRPVGFFQEFSAKETGVGKGGARKCRNAERMKARFFNALMVGGRRSLI